MDKEKLKKECRRIIRNQLEEGRPESTVQVYDHLIKHGYSENEAIDKLAFCIGESVIDMLIDNEEYDEELWNDRIHHLLDENLIDAQIVSSYQLSKISSRIRKEFGMIEHGDEDDYLDGLMAYESNLMAASHRYDLNSQQLKAIVELWMYHLYGSFHHIAYDFREAAHEEHIQIADQLCYYSNPLWNHELAKELKENYSDLKMNEEEKLNSSFKMVFLLLGRIYDSINYWEKQYGSNGYLIYLDKVMNNDFG